MFATAEKIHLNGKARSMHKTINKAANRIEDDAEDAVSTIYEAAAAIKDDVESLAQTAGRRVRQVIGTAETNVTEVTGNVSAMIQEKPLQSAAIALGVGIVFGMLLRRNA